MQLLSILFEVVGPVCLVAAVGYAWARSGTAFDVRFVSLLVTHVGTPCLVIDSLTKSTLSLKAFGTIGFATLLCHGSALVAGYLFVRAMRESVPAFVPALAFPNTGNMGLPMALFAFGEAGLALAIAVYATSSMIQFSVGEAIAAGGAKLSSILKLPVIWAVSIAIVLAVTGVKLPSIADRAVHILGGMMVPLMLLSLGYSLASLKTGSLGQATIFALARLFGGFAIGWGVATLLGLEGAARGVVVIQAAMPCAVFNYMFAERYNNKPQEVAGLVVVSTLLSVVVLPFFLASVIGR